MLLYFTKDIIRLREGRGGEGKGGEGRGGSGGRGGGGREGGRGGMTDIKYIFYSIF